MVKKGFTLIEILIVIVVLGIIVVGSTELLYLGFRGFHSSQNIINANWQGKVAFERMTRDLHAIRSSADITTATAGQITFTDINDDMVTYQRSGTQLILTLNGNAEVLADGIQNLIFNYFDSTGANTADLNAIRYITVTLDIVANDATLNLTTGVYPWNLI